jgi:hypothetical protein
MKIVFGGLYSLLDVKLSEADNLIAAGNFDRAKYLIEEVLESAPGPNVGGLPNSGEVHWRKLLAEIGCKNNAELVVKGKLLRKYPAFINAMNYGNNDERRVYTSVEREKQARYTQVKNAIEKGVVAEKIKINVGGLLGEYKKELDVLQKRVLANVTNLDRIEEEIREEVIDCGIVVCEYEIFVNAVHSAVNKMNDINIGDELTLEQKNSYLKTVNNYLALSSQEIDNQKKLATADEHYLKYSELLGKQREVVSAIRGDISKINDLQRRIASLLERIDAITKKYADAMSALEDGDYGRVISLLRT